MYAYMRAGRRPATALGDARTGTGNCLNDKTNTVRGCAH